MVNVDVRTISYISRVVGDYIIIYTVYMCKVLFMLTESKSYKRYNFK